MRETVWEELWGFGPALDGRSTEGPEWQWERTETFLSSLLRQGKTEVSLLAGLTCSSRLICVLPRQSIPLLQSYTHHLLSLDPPRCHQALDQLEIYLPSLPFSNSPSLHALAGMCALALAVEDKAARGTHPSFVHPISHADLVVNVKTPLTPSTSVKRERTATKPLISSRTTRQTPLGRPTNRS